MAVNGFRARQSKHSHGYACLIAPSMIAVNPLFPLFLYPYSHYTARLPAAQGKSPFCGKKRRTWAICAFVCGCPLRRRSAPDTRPLSGRGWPVTLFAAIKKPAGWGSGKEDGANGTQEESPSRQIAHLYPKGIPSPLTRLGHSDKFGLWAGICHSAAKTKRLFCHA